MKKQEGEVIDKVRNTLDKAWNDKTLSYNQNMVMDAHRLIKTLDTTPRKPSTKPVGATKEAKSA